MQIVSSLRELRHVLLSWREAGDSVAFVPTMGALHAGHMALVDAARTYAKRSIVSIFVNPTQFAPTEDLATYPRQPEADRKMLADAGCDLLYMPEADEMYGEGFATQIDPGPLAKVLEGEFRPHFFYGVATVVVKLLLQIMPDIAFFGEKDFQQLTVVRHVVRDLNIPIHIAGIRTVRDQDGLALSSRNAYLSKEERQKALALPQSLADTALAIAGGGNIQEALKAGIEKMKTAGFEVDYLRLTDAETLEPIDAVKRPARLLAAVRIGKTRLIDNIAVDKS
ncbi:MAG TPA: pantoate--beta-alanine ligase [Alphaproteobacteria bacterium]|nr:pantoate--beta-alanine ligase [Alphaproteobacteria bacterium]